MDGLIQYPSLPGMADSFPFGWILSAVAPPPIERPAQNKYKHASSEYQDDNDVKSVTLLNSIGVDGFQYLSTVGEESRITNVVTTTRTMGIIVELAVQKPKSVIVTVVVGKEETKYGTSARVADVAGQRDGEGSQGSQHLGEGLKGAKFTGSAKKEEQASSNISGSHISSSSLKSATTVERPVVRELEGIAIKIHIEYDETSEERRHKKSKKKGCHCSASRQRPISQQS